jgi:hypothetical protein
MKKILLLAAVAFWFGCEPKQGKSVEDVPQTTSDSHSIVVQEVLQANSYTYLHGADGDQIIWMAIPKREVEVGKTYYFVPGMEMKDFKSKDLDREFESIFFISGISETPDLENKIDGKGVMPQDEFHTKQDPTQQQELSIQPEEGVTSVGTLYAHREEYENKKIKVKGVVTKFNPEIMDKNWVHIQDGSGDEKGFDLTITTLDNVGVGSIATFEGVLVLNKDFGHGYKYDLLLQDAVQLNKSQDMKVN